MKKIDILPEGIRRVSGEQEAGAASCDNMLNLRYEYNALKLVGEKETLSNTHNYTSIYEHKLPNTTNLIVTYWDAEEKMVVRDITNNKDIDRFIPLDDDRFDISFINNIMTIAVSEAEANGGQRLVSFVWRDGGYSKFFDGELPVHPSFDIDTNLKTEGDRQELLNVELLDFNSFSEQVKALENKIRLKDKDNFTQGYVLVCMNYTLFDGSQTRPTPPRMVKTDILGVSDSYSVRYSGDTSATMDLSVSMVTASIEITPAITNEFYSANKDIIKSINFYSTVPKKYFNIDKVYEEYNTDLISFFNVVKGDKTCSLTIGDTQSYGKTGETLFTLPISQEKPEGIADELFYLQKSISLSEDETTMNEPFTLTMQESLMGQQIMNVDASGYFRYFGDILSYNNRLHLYNIKRRLYINPDILSFGTADGSIQTTAVVYIKTDLTDLRYVFTFHSKVIYANQPEVILAISSSDFISFPDSRAYKIDLFFDYGDNKYLSTIGLKPSKSQNFAYSDINTTVRILTTAPTDIVIPEAKLSYSDTDTVVVSAQSNPAYFDNSHSYRVQGNISSLAVLTDGVSDLQIGQFPVAVFTDSGIYALNQGTGNILYSSAVKISTVEAISRSLQSKVGIFFIAKDGIYNLSGRNVTKISELLEGEPDEDIQSCPNFALCCKNNGTYNVENIPNIKDYLKYYAVLAYDDYEDELFVSVNNTYSLVYNVKTKNWHSVDFHIIFAKGKYAIRSGGGRTRSVVNLNNEVFTETDGYAQKFHLQTRALTFGSYDYKTIQRIIERCDVSTNKVSERGMVSLYLFGSNDIKNWYLIGSSQFHNGYTDKLQIQKVASNYKYFIFVLGGYANQNSIFNRIEVLFSEKYANKLR